MYVCVSMMQLAVSTVSRVKIAVSIIPLSVVEVLQMPCRPADPGGSGMLEGARPRQRDLGFLS